MRRRGGRIRSVPRENVMMAAAGQAFAHPNTRDYHPFSPEQIFTWVIFTQPIFTWPIYTRSIHTWFIFTWRIFSWLIFTRPIFILTCPTFSRLNFTSMLDVGICKIMSTRSWAIACPKVHTFLGTIASHPAVIFISQIQIEASSEYRLAIKLFKTVPPLHVS